MTAYDDVRKALDALSRASERASMAYSLAQTVAGMRQPDAEAYLWSVYEAESEAVVKAVAAVESAIKAESAARELAQALIEVARRPLREKAVVDAIATMTRIRL